MSYQTALHCLIERLSLQGISTPSFVAERLLGSMELGSSVLDTVEVNGIHSIRADLSTGPYYTDLCVCVCVCVCVCLCVCVCVCVRVRAYMAIARSM